MDDTTLDDIAPADSLIKSYPHVFPNPNAVYNTWRNRKKNGCERAGAIFKWRGRLWVNKRQLPLWMMFGEKASAA